MRTSEQLKEFYTALSKFQGSIKGAIKDSENPFFSKGDKKSLYADLDACWEAIREELSKNGFSIIQGEAFKETMWIMETRLAHSSGQWIETDYPIKAIKEDPQTFLAASTYARRGSLSAIIGLSQRDDDGNEASERPVQTRQQPEIKNVQQRPQQAPLPKQSSDAAQGSHEHQWLPSHFKKDEEWCSICKLKRPIQ
jgi:hypothetical protein